MIRAAITVTLLSASLHGASANEAYERYKLHMEQQKLSKPAIEKLNKEAPPIRRSQNAMYRDTINSAEIAAALSPSKTSLSKERWWRERMSGKAHQLTGRVLDVESGTISGFWVSIDAGNGITVRCALSDKWASRIEQWKKGDGFVCNGLAGPSWTEIFGLTFTIDAG